VSVVSSAGDRTRSHTDLPGIRCVFDNERMEHIGREPVEVERELREFLTAFLTGISASNVRLSSSPSGLLKRKVKRELQIWIDGEWAPWHQVFPDDDE
jgi:hypothetical protein